MSIMIRQTVNGHQLERKKKIYLTGGKSRAYQWRGNDQTVTVGYSFQTVQVKSFWNKSDSDRMNNKHQFEKIK